jgi:hypothetical protein
MAARSIASVKTYFPRIEASIPSEVQRHLQLIYMKLNNHALAFSSVAQSAAAATAGQKTIGAPVTENQISLFQQLGLSGAGTVNDQRGGVLGRGAVTAYMTQQSDNGALVVVGDPSMPVTVTLDSTVGTPWATFVSNHGGSMTTLIPQTGSITYVGFAGAASMPLPSEFWCMVVFDGADFFAAVQPLVPVYPYKAVTAAYSIAKGDFQIEATANTFTVTLPSAAGKAGTTYSVKNSGAGVVTLATTAAQTIDGMAMQLLTTGDNLTVMSTGSGWIIV